MLRGGGLGRLRDVDWRDVLLEFEVGGEGDVSLTKMGGEGNALRYEGLGVLGDAMGL